MIYNFSGDILSNLVIITIYLLFIFVILKRMEFEKIDWAVFKKVSFFSVVVSLIITYTIREQYNLNYLGIEQIIIIFLLFAFLISIPIYAIICRNKFRYSPLLLNAMFLTIFVSIFLICVFPTINQKDDSHDYDLKEYIIDNVKCAFYLVSHSWEYTWETGFIYEHKIAIYIVNNGSKNIDGSLQINVDCLSNKKFIIENPYGDLNISYFYGSVKPWVFGNDYSVSIRWNDSYAGVPLPKKSARWAIINCYISEYLYCEEYDILNIEVLIDDEHNINITEIPCYVDSPSDYPQEWNIVEVLEDIQYYQ